MRRGCNWNFPFENISLSSSGFLTPLLPLSLCSSRIHTPHSSSSLPLLGRLSSASCVWTSTVVCGVWRRVGVRFVRVQWVSRCSLSLCVRLVYTHLTLPPPSLSLADCHPPCSSSCVWKSTAWCVVCGEGCGSEICACTPFSQVLFLFLFFFLPIFSFSCLPSPASIPLR